MVSTAAGPVTSYALALLQPRGALFVKPGDSTYMGMIIGEYSRDSDIDMNPTKGKKLDNMRSAGTDEKVRIVPPRLFNLEDCIGYVQPGELIEESAPCAPQPSPRVATLR